jgi:signal transduction histidine kinase
VVQDRAAQLDALLTRSGVALGIMALVSIGLGWLMAGRALRPLRTMGARARGISERNLHERLALEGPDDELKELGDTFDGLLSRLENAFESQRRFVANASHELRTPITVERTLVEVALADPCANVESLRATCERVLAAGEGQERLIEALLTLARSQRGLDHSEPLDLAAVTAEVLQKAPVDGVRVRSELGNARMSGDRALVERLVANLVDNALQHNVPSGWLEAQTGIRDGAPTLRVANTGPAIAPEQAADLIEPFRRLNGDRPRHRRGLGLGLSIVDAIASAHGAALIAKPRPGGGLAVEVRFPPAS